MTRCTATRGDRRCRLGIEAHPRDAFGRPVHKWWNNGHSVEWAGNWHSLDDSTKRAWRWVRSRDPVEKVTAAIVVVVIVAFMFPNPFRPLNPDNWNTSDQETGFSCSLGGDTSTQLTHEYASCVYVVNSDIASWH